MRIRTLTGTLALGLGLLASPAIAGKTVEARVTIHLPPGGSAAYLYGYVRSAKHACESHRKMKIVADPDYQTGPEPYGLYADGIKSNADGTWTYAPVSPPYVVNGDYKAIALRKETTRVTCAKAVSKPLFVD